MAYARLVIFLGVGFRKIENFLRRTIVLIQDLVQSLCVSGRPVCRSGMEPVPSWPTYRTATNTEWLYQKFY